MYEGVCFAASVVCAAYGRGDGSEGNERAGNEITPRFGVLLVRLAVMTAVVGTNVC